ncbi:hypothetical protein A1Q2_02766 [Trichosporon asahii var. asahii CBS 8904]|uniref:Methyltransferase domain-containing protein n=1 Tax=Trichosporon asahii var. asahii (strain CBS 8904) TaxID=1220162 RepID=K1VFR9_TRIAC|nr:hypothetical protein A1Q2_02766 [Trichosporon asahii var. asahii CBS 8904]
MRLAHIPAGPEAIPALKKDHIHMSLLNPRHDQLVHLHLDQIHASGRRSKILDVGTGTGSWAISLARRQPYSDVIGIDIAWDQFEGTRLPHGNADFHTVDVTLPLPWGDETFEHADGGAELRGHGAQPDASAQATRAACPRRGRA